MSVKSKVSVSILISLLAIALLAARQIRSAAWFDDTGNSGLTVINAGSLDLEISGGPLKAADLMPGGMYNVMDKICVRNTGNLDLKYRGLLVPPQAEASSMITHLTFMVEKQDGTQWVKVKEVTGTSPSGVETFLDYFKMPNQDANKVNLHIIEGVLASSNQDCYRFSVKLNAAAPASLQMQLLKFDLIVSATQTINRGWN